MQHVGVDISAKKIDVAVRGPRGNWTGEFENNHAGHQALIKALQKNGSAQVVMEATANYGLDLALCLHDAERVDVMVINPRLSANFAKAINQRGKTDPGDAAMLAEFAATRPFVAWTPPSPAVLQLRQLSRLIHELVGQRTQEKNRIYAAERTKSTLPEILETLREHVTQLDTHIAKLEESALRLIADDRVLRRRFELLDSIPGVAARSALYILAEVAHLPGDLDVRQLVAYAGLDPKPWESGSSVRGRRHISKRGNKYLRHALYMPAVQAARYHPVVKAYAADVEARATCRKQALCAVMRKFLHSIVGMFASDTPFDPQKFRARA